VTNDWRPAYKPCARHEKFKRTDVRAEFDNVTLSQLRILVLREGWFSRDRVGHDAPITVDELSVGTPGSRDSSTRDFSFVTSTATTL
jgi:hypothetical protein